MVDKASLVLVALVESFPEFAIELNFGCYRIGFRCPTHKRPAGGRSCPLKLSAGDSLFIHKSVMTASRSCQKDPAMIAANDASPMIMSAIMNGAAKRDDVFHKPVLIGVRGWYFQPLRQIKSGFKSVRATCLMPRPANDR